MITKEFLLIVSLVLCNTELGMLGPSPAISQTSQAVLESAAFKRCYNDYAARTSQEDLYGLKEYLKSALEDGAISEDMLHQEMAQGHLRTDAMTLVEAA